MKRSFKELNKDIILLLYRGLIRGKLEFCVQAWSPYYMKKDQLSLEGVQGRATKMVPGLQDKSYQDRLKELGLITLMQRRVRGDMIELYRLLHGFDKVDCRKFVKLCPEGRTRGNNLKLFKERSRLLIRSKFFSQKVVNVWNSLPNNIVNAPSVATFKS